MRSPKTRSMFSRITYRLTPSITSRISYRSRSFVSLSLSWGSTTLTRYVSPSCFLAQSNDSRCGWLTVSGDHTRTIQIATPTIGGLMKFAVKTVTCLGCKTPLKANNSRGASSCTLLRSALRILTYHCHQNLLCATTVVRSWVRSIRNR